MTASTHPDPVLQVEKTLFKVPLYLFIQDSPVFRTMHELPPGPDGDAEGSSDEHPIMLKGISATDFRMFLFVLYPL